MSDSATDSKVNIEKVHQGIQYPRFRMKTGPVWYSIIQINNKMRGWGSRPWGTGMDSVKALCKAGINKVRMGSMGKAMQWHFAQGGKICEQKQHQGILRSKINPKLVMGSFGLKKSSGGVPWLARIQVFAVSWIEVWLLGAKCMREIGNRPRLFVIAARYPWLSEIRIHKMCDRREKRASKATARFKNRRSRRY